MAEVADPQEDAVARRLMAQVAHAKSSSFIALLDADGHVLDVNPAALIAGGVDRAEVDRPAAVDDARGGRRRPTRTSATLERAVARGRRRPLRPLRRRRPRRAARRARHARPPAAPAARARRAGRLHRRRGPHDHRPQARRAAARAPERRALGADRAPRARARLPRAAARRALARPARAAAGRDHALRAAAALATRRRTLRAQVVNIRLAALGALEQINDMLEQVKADHGEARLALVDADLARAVRTVAESVRAAGRGSRASS